MDKVMEYVPPEHDLDSFYCPHCNVYAHQLWFGARFIKYPDRQSSGYDTLGIIQDLEVKKCAHCEKLSFWYHDVMVYPAASIAPLPSADMPPDIAVDFNEAREVLAKSPRASAALLRLAIQKLCKHLGQPGENINGDIGALVKAGLPPRIQQALDIVRVIGNNAVHPGEIDLRDDHKTALVLFGLVNLIVEVMITRPREIDEIYNKLPAVALEGIARRDKTP